MDEITSGKQLSTMPTPRISIPDPDPDPDPDPVLSGFAAFSGGDGIRSSRHLGDVPQNPTCGAGQGECNRRRGVCVCVGWWLVVLVLVFGVGGSGVDGVRG